MAQTSGPIATGSTAERQFTDVLWRDRFGDEPGVLSDYDGSAYAVALSTNSDVASVGSATQSSLATVAGFVHKIPAGSPESITIPAASGSSRTDIISLRYDPTYTGSPGPVRLFRIAGTNSSIPTYDSTPPGVEDLPLWAITRTPGQALSQATLTRMFPRIAPMMEVATTAPLPLSSPLGTQIKQGTKIYYRELGSGSVPTWVAVNNTPEAPVRVGYLNSQQFLSSGTAGNTATTIATINATVPSGLTTGQRIEIIGTVFCATPSGVGAAISISGGAERQLHTGSITGDLSAFRIDTSLTSGSRSYSLRVRSTVSGQNVTWRFPHLSVKVV